MLEMTKAKLSEVIVNNDACDVDFRIETLNNDRIFRVDAGNDTVTIGDGGVTNYTQWDSNGTTKLLGAAIKSGATQAAAGAVAGEIWKTSSHDTLPDNVLMIGVP